MKVSNAGPVLLAGSLGCISDNLGPGLTEFLRDFSLRQGGSGDETFSLDSVERDARDGSEFLRLHQTVQGLTIVGAGVVIRKASSGDVAVLAGEILPVDYRINQPRLSGSEALRSALLQAHIEPTTLSPPVRAYVRGEDGVAHPAWRATVEYLSDEGPEADDVFSDMDTGELVARHPRIHRALSRETYTAGGTDTLPGTLLFAEGGSSADAAAQAAYDNAGDAYTFFQEAFGRDSFNDTGGLIRSSVHVRVNYNNAFWNGVQMAYGDGDGVTFAPLSRSLDVVAHEITHAVTQFTAGLIYQNESGALNEAMSDILGVSASVFATGGTPDASTWLLGEDVYTPGTAGDALRYLNDPVADTRSFDYYPTRFTGTADNGGVHINSGIANLAFYLMVTGGTHPRARTTVDVPAIGLEHARDIFYRALTRYLTASSGFENARLATAQAAQELFGFDAFSSVHMAWDAVGVPGGDVGITPDFTADQTAGYAPLSVSFSDRSTGATAWAWDFGDETRSSEQNPTKTFEKAGTYQVTLVVGGYSRKVTDIVVFEKPLVDFSASTVAGTRVQFENLSTGNIKSYEWDFGDGTYSDEVAPEHQYREQGTYSVRLIVEGEAGPVEAYKEDYVFVDPDGAGFNIGMDLGCDLRGERLAPRRGLLILIALAGLLLLQRKERGHRTWGP